MEIYVHCQLSVPKEMQIPAGSILPGFQKYLGAPAVAAEGLPGPAVFAIRDNLIEYIKTKKGRVEGTGGGMGKYDIFFFVDHEVYPEIRDTVREVLPSGVFCCFEISSEDMC